jgi:hypothetical protein
MIHLFKKKYYPMKKKQLHNKLLIICLTLIFVFYSLFLLYKQNRKINIIKENSRIELYYLQDKIELLNITLKENLLKSGNTLFIDDCHILKTDKNQKTVILFLEKNACSECYITTIKTIIHSLRNLNHFYIISHESNSSIINETKTEINTSIKTIWTNEDLYYNSVPFMYNSTLILVDSFYTIRWVLPIEFLNESIYLDDYITFIKKTFN